MATNNSTALNQDITPSKYSDFACNFAYELYRVKAMVAGAKTMVYECEKEFTEHPELMDSAYLLDDVVERITELASKISNSEFDYQEKDQTK